MENDSYRIMLVDDEPDVLEFIGYNIKKEGYQIATCSNGREAIDKAKEFNPHLIILDVMMPEMDGIETCTELRKLDFFKNTLIVFLTARGEDYSQIAGLEAGADDYLTKPVKPKVLVSRLKAILRRYREENSHPDHIVDLDGLIIDSEKYLVVKDGEEIFLPKKEFELLSLFSSRPNKVFTREEIFSNIWGNNVIVGDRTIDVHVRKIREKIGLDNIVTVKGVGYKYKI